MADELIPEDNEFDLEKNFDPEADYLEQLVGEGKKFKSPQELARGKYEADLYIKTLTQRMDEMRNDYTQLRTDYNSRAKLEEILDQMKTQPVANTPQANEVDKPEIKTEDLIQLINTEFQKNKVQEIEETNYKTVQSKLKERFGSNREALKQHLDELDLSEDFVKQLARKNPKLVIRTLGLDQPQHEDYLGLPRSTQRPDRFAPKAQKRTWQYYQDLKKKNPELYNSKTITVQMHKDYEELGEAFEDGDFKEDIGKSMMYRG